MPQFRLPKVQAPQDLADYGRIRFVPVMTQTNFRHTAFVKKGDNVTRVSSYFAAAFGLAEGATLKLLLVDDNNSRAHDLPIVIDKIDTAARDLHFTISYRQLTATFDVVDDTARYLEVHAKDQTCLAFSRVGP